MVQFHSVPIPKLGERRTEVSMLSLILLVFALVLFVVAAVGVSSSKFNLVAAGLAFMAASMLFPRLM